MSPENTSQPTFIKKFKDIQEGDLPLVGGKCLNLGLLINAGFPVPDGFCVTTQAYEAVKDDTVTLDKVNLPEGLGDEILAAYHYLGGGRVAVRSSATAEDLPGASFAGQQDTFLNVHGGAELIEAIRKCWMSLWSDRAVAYRRQKRITDSKVSMAVAVQRMLEPDSSGVMFSVSPANTGQLVIEASWGLGEAVVSGKVTPDRFTVERNTLRIVDRAISAKKIMISERGEVEVAQDRQRAPSLSDDQIVQLARLGLEIEEFYSAPQDIEWALTDGEFHILQSRPVTAYQPVLDQELQQLRQEEISRLRKIAHVSGTVWCTFNLSETLPAPLPMTWGIISRFMSGHGGFGMAYRKLGFIPGREVYENGVVDLICGRCYFNLSREVQLYFDGVPFEHSFEKLKENPTSASYPQPTLNIRRSTAKFWLKFPYYIYKMVAVDRKMKRVRRNYDDVMKTEIIPKYCRYINEQREIKLTALSDDEIILKMNEWTDRTLCDFARDSLIASIIAGMSYSNLQLVLTRCFGEESRSILDGLTVGLEGDPTVDMNQKLWEIAHKQHIREDEAPAEPDHAKPDPAEPGYSIEEFLDDYGHRAVGEFELAQPRWREDTGYLESVVNMFREHEETDPRAQFLSQKQRREKTQADLESRLSSGKARAYRRTILRNAQFVQKYLPYREIAKFYLMMGYELIRKALLELDKRHFDAREDIFYLTPDELQPLAGCKDATDRAFFQRKAAERRERRDRLLRIDLPDVIFSDSLDQIGDPPAPKFSHELEGVPVSGGMASGKAKVFTELPQSLQNMETDYILVCPSTDPGWAPLFPGARGLVMERGGILSHGAIVAREYGIPAVVNVPGATSIIKDNQQIRVDGNRGVVFI